MSDTWTWAITGALVVLALVIVRVARRRSAVRRPRSPQRTGADTQHQLDAEKGRDR